MANSLSAGSPSADLRRTETIRGKSLSVSLDAVLELLILPADTSSVNVVAVADSQEELDSLIFADGATARIKQSSTSGGNITSIQSADGRISISGISGGNVSVSGRGGSISISGGSRPVTMRLAIQVPRNFDVELDTSGTVKSTIGDIGALNLEASGQCRTSCSKVSGNLKAELSGQSGLTIEDLAADKTAIDASGQCHISVARGATRKLKAEASGQTRLELAVTAQSAKLDASGMSAITVDAVTGELDEDSSGMSSIKVKERGIAADSGSPARRWR